MSDHHAESARRAHFPFDRGSILWIGFGLGWAAAVILR